MVNRGRGDSYHLQNTFQNDITEQSIPTSQHVDSNRRIIVSHQSDSQHVHTSQDDSSQQETHQNVSTEQQTLASDESSNPPSRRDVVQAIRPLKVNGVTFFPHDVVRDVSKSFKKSFTGSWHSWSKVPEISAINSKNRMTCNDEEGPSVHTGGSVAFAEYRRRHKEETGQDLRNDELFLKTHMTKDKDWICGKSQRVWDVFTENIKKNVNNTNSSKNENGSEVERDLERNIPTDGHEETNGEETKGDDVVKLLKTIPDEQLLNTWLNAVGGAKKGKIYGLGSDVGIIGGSRHVSSTSSCGPTLNVSTQQIIEVPEFQQTINRLLEQ